MRTENDSLILEGEETKAYEMIFMRLVEDKGVKTAMQQTWPLFPNISKDSRGAVMVAALTTLGKYMVIRTLRPDLDNLTIYEAAREQAKIFFQNVNPTQGNRAVGEQRFPDSGDRKIVAVRGVASISATLKPAGNFGKAVKMMGVLMGTPENPK